VGDKEGCVLKQERNRAWCCTVFCTETEEKYNVGYVQCCVLEQERNRAWVIYSVVYRYMIEIDRE